ncbi:MAG: nucleotidyltransferase domain-containing protein [Bacteroidota bacterium]
MKDHLNSEYQVVQLGLFGSFAKAEAVAESDVDVILEFENGTTGLRDKKKRIRSLLAQKFGRPVDLARIKYLKPYYRDQVLESAVYV